MSTEEVAKQFHAMADRVTHNVGSGFGGCFVIVPPKDGGATIETLILDSNQDAAQFWTLLQTKCQTQIALLDQAQRGQAFRR